MITKFFYDQHYVWFVCPYFSIVYLKVQLPVFSGNFVCAEMLLNPNNNKSCIENVVSKVNSVMVSRCSFIRLFYQVFLLSVLQTEGT